jgi:hypothetical protein
VIGRIRSLYYSLDSCQQRLIPCAMSLTQSSEPWWLCNSVCWPHGCLQVCLMQMDANHIPSRLTTSHQPPSTLKKKTFRQGYFDTDTWLAFIIRSLVSRPPCCVVLQAATGVVSYVSMPQSIRLRARYCLSGKTLMYSLTDSIRGLVSMPVDGRRGLARLLVSSLPLSRRGGCCAVLI